MCACHPLAIAAMVVKTVKMLGAEVGVVLLHHCTCVVF